jgi:hypothetical protein
MFVGISRDARSVRRYTIPQIACDPPPDFRAITRLDRAT